MLALPDLLGITYCSYAIGSANKGEAHSKAHHPWHNIQMLQGRSHAF